MPIPKNSIGLIIPELVPRMQNRNEKLGYSLYNAQQVSKVFANNILGYEGCECKKRGFDRDSYVSAILSDPAFQEYLAVLQGLSSNAFDYQGTLKRIHQSTLGMVDTLCHNLLEYNLYLMFLGMSIVLGVRLCHSSCIFSNLALLSGFGDKCVCHVVRSLPLGLATAEL